MMKKRGFTLIELLIVVAIIAILAAIAVPNFLEAQIRSKVARSLADMHSIRVALEAYAVDNNHYPPHDLAPAGKRLTLLSTPVAYITQVPPDIFANRKKDPVTWLYHQDMYIYDELAPLIEIGHWPHYTYNQAYRQGKKWLLMGRGPDQVYSATFYASYYIDGKEISQYDPTNGTVSIGDLENFGP